MMMNLHKIFCFLITIILLAAQDGHATSLDDIYRDIIRSNNSGYLPLFVKNRHQPSLLLDDEDLQEAPSPSQLKLLSPNQKVKLSSDFNHLDALAKARHYQWLKTIAAVKSNQVTPLELNEIYNRARNQDPKAIEILAWMYTKGVGVTMDFVEAFNLYKKAATLNVTNAEQNAMRVYQAMTETQRQKVKNKL